MNEESIEITKLSLWIKTAQRGKVLDSLSGSIRVGDSLIEDSNYAYLDHAFTWETAFPEVFAEGGFDVVLGNPPYVRQEMFSSLKPYLQNRFVVYHGAGDLFTYFYERGLRILKPGGRLGYISSNTFFKTGSGKPLREYLASNATIEKVVDFGDLQVFEGVTTYPAILTMRKEVPTNGHKLQFWKVDSLPESNFKAAWEAAAGPYPQTALGGGTWELESQALRALRDKIKSGRPSLKKAFGAPFRGVVTGLNAAFVIDTQTKEDLCAQDPRSADLLKPFLEGKDLKRWRAESRGLWLIFTRRGTEIDDYPAIKAHLEKVRESLEPKPKGWSGDKWPGRKAGSYKWFEIQDTIDYHSHFEAPKISYPHFNSTRNFSYEPSGAFSNDKSYLIPSSDLALLSLLNSRVIWFVLASMSPPVRGGYHELRVQYVETLPIPNWSPSQKDDLAKLAKSASDNAQTRLKLQSNFTRRIPDLCPPEREAKLNAKLKTWWTLPGFTEFRAEVKKVFKSDIPLSERSDWEDWLTRDRAEINRLTAEIAKTEAKIDAIVYDLFDLTPEEITLLEAAVSN